jgi:hypothetical protein
MRSRRRRKTSSTELLRSICTAEEDSRFREWWWDDRDDKPNAKAAKDLSTRLKQFEITPGKFKKDGVEARGYGRASFEPVWERYALTAESTRRPVDYRAQERMVTTTDEPTGSGINPSTTRRLDGSDDDTHGDAAKATRRLDGSNGSPVGLPVDPQTRMTATKDGTSGRVDGSNDDLPMPGDPGFREFINAELAAGRASYEEAHALRIKHYQVKNMITDQQREAGTVGALA